MQYSFHGPFQFSPKVYPTDRLLRILFLWMIPSFVTPNHITLVRMIATPFVLALLFREQYAVGVPLFLVVALTDALDGALARTRNMITQWGTFFDPLADKFLVVPVLLILMARNLPTGIAIAIVTLEIVIMVCAVVWLKQGHRVVQANIFGKIKMILQICGIMALLAAVWLALPFADIASALLLTSVGFGIIALFRYGI